MGGNATQSARGGMSSRYLIHALVQFSHSSVFPILKSVSQAFWRQVYSVLRCTGSRPPLTLVLSYSEMYALIIASVQLNLPFTFIKSIVVSETTSKDREGWPYVDDLPDDQIWPPPIDAPLPIGLHYCKRYNIGEVMITRFDCVDVG
jgi:hypothetical protein